MKLRSQETKTKVYILMKYQIFIYFLVLLYSSSYSQSFIIDGTPKIAYWEYGNAEPTIIIINGGPGIDHTYLRPEWDTLSSISRIIYYDQRGCGESDNSINYSWIEHLKDLKRLKDQLSPGKKIVLAASSWGTNIALLFSLYFPNDTKGLILSGFPDWRGINFKKVDLYMYQIDSVMNFKRTLPISDEIISIAKSKIAIEQDSFAKASKSKSVVPSFNKILKWKSKEAHQQTFNSQPSMPELTFFTEIHVPTLILTGDLYCGYSDWSDILAKKIAGSVLFIIENSCHDPWYSNPTVFFAKCFEFIKKFNQ